MDQAAAEYRELLEGLDRWFADAAARHPSVIPCRAGCTACCHGPFDISVADAHLLRAGLDALPPELRSAARKRASSILTQMRALEPEWGPPYDVRAIDEDHFDALTEQLSAAPCPLLGNTGACMVYEHRPMVCRLIGLPMMTAEGELLENACPIQDDFPAYASLTPQLFDLGALHEAEVDALEAAAGAGDPLFETTIAAVVAERR
jgi:Fe-S-cluster containining protein